MGCTASRVANEDTVRRCKERRRLMKDAVYSRHHLAAAHSDYVRSLRQTATALTRFASFQSLSVSDQTPPVVLHPPAQPPKPLMASSAGSNTTPTQPPASAAAPPQYRQYQFHHQQQAPPQPQQNYQFFPNSPTETVASEKLPPIRTGKPSAASTPAHSTKKGAYDFPHAPAAPRSNYSATPSQSSSAWDWEKFYPPSPPGSDFFDRLDQERREKEELDRQVHQQRQQQQQKHQFENHHLSEEDGGGSTEDEEEREEAHCSDWGDHYSSASSSDAAGEEEDGESRSEGINTATYYYGAVPTAASVDHHHLGRSATPSQPGSASFGRSGRRDRWIPEDVETISTFDRDESASAVAAAPDMRLVLRHRDLKEIVASIEENFLKAAAAGEALTDLLETGSAQLDRSFRQLKKTVYHSTGVLSNISSTWSSKPPLAIKYQLDTAVLTDSGGEKGHSSTLERLLAWEKKLYEEVKAREGVKIEHEKKLAALQSQEHRGKDDLKLAKIKASIQRLQSLILVTSQAVTTTSTAIIKVRDDELAPQLLKLCLGFMTMWKSMNQFHEVQNHIVQQVRGLVNHSVSLESTSDLHRQATRDLESAVSDWHSSFTRLVKFHHDYIHSLHEWLKLTLFQVSTDEPATKDPYSSLVSSELTAFCDAWKQAVDGVPGTVPAEALKSFITVVHSIYLKQAEELKIKKRVEAFSKELEKKSIALKAIEKKFYRSYSTVGIALPGQGSDINGQVFDARDPLAEKKSEIAACRRRLEEEMARHTKAVVVTRDMTLNNIQTGLPGVFQAMTGFSGLLAEALAMVCRQVRA